MCVLIPINIVQETSMAFTDQQKTQIIQHIQTGLERRYTRMPASSLNKCSRDLDHILNGIRDDLNNDSNVNTKFICRTFFKNGISELSRTDIEARAYTEMKVQLQSIITNQDLNYKAGELCDILIDSMNSSSSIPNLDSNVLEHLMDRRTCRSFSNTQLPTYDQVQILKQSCIASPSKNNNYPFEVKILGPNATAEKEALYLLTECEPDGSPFYNPQILAPYVFLFFCKTSLSVISNDDTEARKEYRDSYVQSGLTAMSIALTAKDLGLATGFVQAINNYQEQPLVNHWLDTLLFGLGVGYARTDVPDERYRTKPQNTAESASGPIGPKLKPDYRDWLEEIGM